MSRMALWERDISTGQTGRVHGMVAIQKWRCPAEFLFVLLFLLFRIWGPSEREAEFSKAEFSKFAGAGLQRVPHQTH